MRLPLIAVFLAFCGVASAAPPEGSDGRYSAWFRALETPNGYSCCDLADCREVRWRVGPQGYEALITPETHGNVGAKTSFWLPIPQDRIIIPPEHARDLDRPPGAVVCWRSNTLYCFVRGIEG